MIDRIEGTRVILRKITLEDVTDEYASWFNDDEIRKYIENQPPKPYTKAMLETYVKQMLNEKDNYMFVILDKTNGTHIGNVKLHNFNHINGTCEYGMVIGNKQYWNKGYGEEVSNMIFDLAFNTLGMRKMWATIKANNPRVIRMVEKLGFTIEGCLRKHTFSDGEFVDKIFLGLFAEEFNKK